MNGQVSTIVALFFEEMQVSLIEPFYTFWGSEKTLVPAKT
jgi:hypothetical protein